jgi:hypothetical protein
MSSGPPAAVSPLTSGEPRLFRAPAPVGEAPPPRPSSLADETDWPDLAVDCRDLYALSDQGLAMLASLHRQVAARGGRLTLLNVQLPVYVVLAVTRLAEAIDVR